VLDPVELGDELFDIVFTSYGALNWLPDLGAWGRVIARHLKPGGMFHIVEFHGDLILTEARKSVKLFCGSPG
jgi:hypothetical protein